MMRRYFKNRLRVEKKNKKELQVQCPRNVVFMKFTPLKNGYGFG